MSSQTKLIKDIFSLYNTILENKEMVESENMYENVDTLRSTLTDLGYTEKNNELTSGGGVNDVLTDLVSNILKKYHTYDPSVKVMISAGNDTFHQNLGGAHTKGNAIDVTITPYNATTSSSFVKILNDTKSSDNKFSYIDEYTNPSANSTGRHYHLQYNDGTTQNNTPSTGTTTGTTTTPVKSEYDDMETKWFKSIGTKLLNRVGIKEDNVKKSLHNKKITENIDRIKGLLK